MFPRFKHLKHFTTAVAMLWAASVPAATTNLITGLVTNDAAWSGTNLLVGTVTIQSNVTVTISPGTRMLMSNAATLVVNGRLLADGTTNEPILFTRGPATTSWSRMMFVYAAPSRLRNCVIEYANSAGDHQDYYPTNCSPPIFRPRVYHEAIVALRCHLDVEGCVFQNLLGGANNDEGDALAIISDHPDPTDTNSWNSASGTVRGSRFLGIGQGIHTRYAYVLVESCLFTNKHGDNDDIDLYGESSPPPLIRSNIFLSGHEDKINPTRCSAIIVGNFVSGSDDHGIVLRDKCKPVVMNNVISNCTAAAISVQNQCDALIANNTIVNCGRGVRLFDHTGRHGPPYCLFPGNGRATVVNCIIRGWTTAAFALEQSTFQPYPYLAVYHCNVQSGANQIVTNGSNNTIIWGPGNISTDPQFTNGQHLRATSPCIDTGTNAPDLLLANWTATPTNDLESVPRPLDGNGDGLARFDIGAYEFLLATADSNGDGIPDGWTWNYGLNPADPAVAGGNPDGDAQTTFEEWVADTNPTNAASHFRITGISAGPPVSVSFASSSNRQYTLLGATNLGGSNTFTAVPGQVNVPGNGGTRSLNDTNLGAQKFYRVGVRVP
jgi:hypothetical protein